MFIELMVQSFSDVGLMEGVTSLMSLNSLASNGRPMGDILLFLGALVDPQLHATFSPAQPSACETRLSFYPSLKKQWWDLAATCEGSHVLVAAFAFGDGEHCSTFHSDKVRNGTSCTAERLRGHAVSPLAEAEKAHHANAPSKLARFSPPLIIRETFLSCMEWHPLWVLLRPWREHRP